MLFRSQCGIDLGQIVGKPMQCRGHYVTQNNVAVSGDRPPVGNTDMNILQRNMSSVQNSPSLTKITTRGRYRSVVTAFECRLRLQVQITLCCMSLYIK